MFTLSSAQMEALQTQADDGFVETVRAFLAEAEPAFLPRFPADVQRQITGILITRAEAAGAHTQHAIGHWALMLLTLGGHLPHDPAVRAWLASTGATADQRIQQLDTLLTASDVDRIVASRQDLPWFTPPALDLETVWVRTCAALPLLLWESTHRADDSTRAQAACAAARQLGMEDLDDAPLALAVANALYGGSLASRPRWLNDLQDPRLPARTRLELLRARIMFDHGRWA